MTAELKPLQVNLDELPIGARVEIATKCGVFVFEKLSETRHRFEHPDQIPVELEAGRWRFTRRPSWARVHEPEPNEEDE